MRYEKAPILEAVLEFRWASSKSLDELKVALESSIFDGFDAGNRTMMPYTALRQSRGSS